MLPLFIRLTIATVVLTIVWSPLSWGKGATSGFISAAHIDSAEFSEGAVASLWQRLYSAGLIDLKNRRYERAETQLNQAIKEARQKGGNDYQLALSRNALGNVFLGLEKYKEAGALFAWSLGALKHEHDELQVANSLNGLAFVALQCDEWERAAKLAKEALRIRESMPGQPNSELGQSLSILASASGKLGEHQEAERFFQKALRILEADPGVRKLDLADGLRQAALYYQSTAQRQVANELFERCYAINDKAAHFAEPASLAGLVSFSWEDGSPRSLEFPDYDVPLRYFTSAGLRVAAAVVDLWELMGVLITITNVSNHPMNVAVTSGFLSETIPHHVSLEMIDPTRIDRTRRELQIWDITYKRPWLANIQKTRAARGFVPAHGHDLWRGPNVFGIYGDWDSAPKILPETLSLEMSPELVHEQAKAAMDMSMIHSADVNFRGMTTVSLDPFESRTGLLFYMNPRSLEVLLRVPVGNVEFKFPFKCRKRRIAEELSLPILSMVRP